MDMRMITMKINRNIFWAIASLALAMLSCQAVTGGGSTDVPDNSVVPVGTDIPVPAPTESQSQNTGKIIFSDDFSSDQWGTGTDTDSAVEYVDNALKFDVFTSNYFVWSTPDDNEYEIIHMEVTVLNHGTDSTTAFGLICDKSSGKDFYYVALTPAGQYAIAKAVDGEKDVFLTNNDDWASSDLIPQNADSYQVGMDCGHGILTLYVDGNQIASVDDSSYTSGRVAVLVWSGEDDGITNSVSFDDFVMRKLK